MVDLYPIPTYLVDKISREAWSATAPVLRDEIIRVWDEMLAGEAILKDRRCGRKKKARGVSFYELHLLEMENWRRPDARKLAESDELRAKLAPDVERMRETDEIFEKYEPMAAKSGKQLKDVIANYIAMEHFIRHDPEAGIQVIARNMGIDFRKICERVLEAEANSIRSPS